MSTQLSKDRKYLSMDAEFDGTGKHRYSLTRQFTRQPWSTAVFIGLNPSTATETEDDPTIRRCVQFAKDWDCGKLVMCNLFSYRATDPKVMKAQSTEANGADNSRIILRECQKARMVICAWGVHGEFMGRAEGLSYWLKRQGIDLYCLGTTKDGHPKHPLYLRKDTKPIPFKGYAA